jgi:16S rRNA (cytidine1402-2'-O)-methyltransferase
VFGEVPIALMRELTKKFEEHLQGTPTELLEHFKSHPPKGEFVLMFHPQGKG